MKEITSLQILIIRATVFVYYCYKCSKSEHQKRCIGIIFINCEDSQIKLFYADCHSGRIGLLRVLSFSDRKINNSSEQNNYWLIYKRSKKIGNIDSDF